MDILEIGKEVIEEEIKTIEKVKEELDENFVIAVEIIMQCKGKVIFTGLGKSGHIGKKLAATFASTGTPSFFVHATEALHGDLGMITKDDVVIAISNSGETKEIIEIIPSLKIIGAKIISMTANENSSLAKKSHIHIKVKAEKEADHLNIAPTASTTSVLAVGDAIGVTLSILKGFKKENFAVFHPGGSLGKMLLSKINLEGEEL
ncbi:SIS domain-containing protein [uncultured Clostridium sp.]|uniref:KpsF/GutQ family sugar-phosphate isomerase n=1 Tax=uncultured Clostridium sp. TaxID=59620 RepID=UPI0028EB47E7|nr:SIS domain-containing protein [uncultured Clostridium sp.]